MGAIDDAIGVLNTRQSSPDTPTTRLVVPVGRQDAQPKSAIDDALDVLNAPKETEKTKPARDIGTGEAFGRGVASGVTANFYDELRGLHEAGGAGPDEPMSLGSVLKGAFSKMTGDQGASQRYDTAVTREREANQAAEKQHPIANLAGNLTGAVALPIGGAAGGATLAARMGRGAMVGAGYGAAYGAGEGDGVTDRASRALSGAAIGGAVGGAAPAVLAGASKVGEVAGAALGHPIQTIKNLINPDQEALRRVGGVVRSDNKAGQAMSPDDITAAHVHGQPISAIDLGGEHTRELARSEANSSTSARASLNDMLDQRYNDQAGRVSEFLRSLSPISGHAATTSEALDRAAKTANRPAYAKAYAEGQDIPYHAGFQQLIASPDVRDAINAATKTGANKAVAQGFPPVKNPFDDAGNLTGNAKPTLQFWDSVKQNLDDKIGSAVRSGEKGHASDLIALKNQLVAHLDDAVPSYRAARAGAAAYFGAENALEAGQKFVGMRGSLDEAHAAISKMNPAQKKLFTEGFASELADKVSKVADNRSAIIDKIFTSQDGRARINMALGSQNAGKLETYLRVENIMQESRKAVQGNSTTTRQLLSSRLAGGLAQTAVASGIGGVAGTAQAAWSGEISTGAVITAGLVAAGVGARSYINANVAKKVGELLSSGNTADMLKVVNMAKGNPHLGKAIRRAEVFVEKASGSRIGNSAPSFTGGAIPAVANPQDNNQPRAGSQ